MEWPAVTKKWTALSCSGVSLAPMAGYSDAPFRRICREMGSRLSYSEFVSTDALTRGNVRTLNMLRFHEDERPVIFQIFGNRPDVIVEGATRIEELQPDGIDLNLGCSVYKVAHKGSGAGLLRDPSLVGRIVEALAKRLAIPVSAKIRLGWDESTRNYLEVAHILQESGASMLAVHGRTAEQAYRGRADWNAIGEIKASLGIPVLGNGDVHTYEEALSLMEKYGVDGVLIGRSAQGNPWIFNREKDGHATVKDVQSVMRQHLKAMLEFHGPEHAHLRFRKHAVQYLRRFPGAAAARTLMMAAHSTDEMLEVIERLQDVPDQQ